MEHYYSNEKHTQMLIALMKAHEVKKIIISPGATNVCFVGSVQQDNYFELYSAVDERSAAYIACGLAAETSEPVALSCTGATASRNYVPALTEAYYRKLPILAITSSQHLGRVGQHFPQVTDRSSPMKDICKLSVAVTEIHNDEDSWANNLAINNALLELRRHGGGPVHINLISTFTNDFSTKILPQVRVIRRYNIGCNLPQIPQGNIGILVGAHKRWTNELTASVDKFCEKYNAVVLCDHTSNYHGNYRVFPCIVTFQSMYQSPLNNFSLLIHIGEISGGYMGFHANYVWRVSPDGEIRDTYKKLSCVFEMEEQDFFENYVQKSSDNKRVSSETLVCKWKKEITELSDKLPELPFSNAWVAQRTAPLIPNGSVVHLGILNSLRSWNYFDVLPERNIFFYSNTGGFGIDGCVSSLIGASLSDSDKLYFGVFGDLSFFYDMNSIGNRHVGNNLRIMLINNGVGTEFKNYNHPAAAFGETADSYMAAMGHNGNKSKDLVCHYATDLGFMYLSASGKEEFMENVNIFTSTDRRDKPILFEIFTNYHDESDALKEINEAASNMKGQAKGLVKGILGEKGVKSVKKLLRKV